MTGFTVDSATLALQTSLVPAGGNQVRQVLLDQIETRLPRDPESRINIQLSELNPGKTASHGTSTTVSSISSYSAASSPFSTRDRASTIRRVTCTRSRSGWCIGP